jgi:hypothetical protein
MNPNCLPNKHRCATQLLSLSSDQTLVRYQQQCNCCTVVPGHDEPQFPKRTNAGVRTVATVSVPYEPWHWQSVTAAALLHCSASSAWQPKLPLTLPHPAANALEFLLNPTLNPFQHSIARGTYVCILLGPQEHKPHSQHQSSTYCQHSCHHLKRRQQYLTQA